jgi:hypothetical protein
MVRNRSRPSHYSLRDFFGGQLSTARPRRGGSVPFVGRTSASQNTFSGFAMLDTILAFLNEFPQEMALIGRMFYLPGSDSPARCSAGLLGRAMLCAVLTSAI